MPPRPLPCAQAEERLQLERERQLALQAQRLLETARREQEEQRRAAVDAATAAAELVRRVETRCAELGAELEAERARGRNLGAAIEDAAAATRRAAAHSADESREWLRERHESAHAAAASEWRLDLACRELRRAEMESRSSAMLAREAMSATANGASEVPRYIRLSQEYSVLNTQDYYAPGGGAAEGGG